MIVQDKNRWILKTDKGLRFFKSKEEAEKAAGISLPVVEVEEIDYAEEEDFDSSEEDSSEEGLSSEEGGSEWLQ